MNLKAGIIGTGGIAGMGILGMHNEKDMGQKKFQASHAGGYNATEDIELVAVADIDSKKADKFGEAWNIPIEGRFDDHVEMVEEMNLDIVSVCTPTYLHHDHVVDVAQTENTPDAIWCEKPIASSISDAEEMRKICESAGIELVINHSFRFTERIDSLRERIGDGLIGDVKSVNAQFRRELLRNSTHLLDTLAFFLGERAATVSGYINGENDAVDALDGDRAVDDAGGGGIVVMDDGTFVTIDCTVARDISSMSYIFIGDEGKLYLNNDDGEWRYWTLEDDTHVEQNLPGIDGTWSWDDDYQKAFQRAAKHVVAVVKGDAKNKSPPEEATKSLEIIIGFYVSHYTGADVDIPLSRPLRDIEITSW
ncbi:Gfo/Idh/MocA family protein [Halovenus marina]|uniref:Gfo/Idh/MocA family protein n=1 Tax=Halovenus marina TaxID=3396621 RepID=UPI003F56213D